MDFVVFQLDRIRVGLKTATIEQVIHAVLITPLPGAPDIAIGVIAVRGVLVPVVNLRQRLGLPEREISLSDRFIIAKTPHRPLAIIADAVDGVFDLPEAHITHQSTLLPGIEQIEGVVYQHDGIIFIHDLERFLSLDEAASLNNAIAAHAGEKDSHAP